MIVALGGVDLLVFTGGIGENDGRARAAICTALSCVGIELDEELNRAPAHFSVIKERGYLISAENSRCAIRLMHSDENREIARHAWLLARDK